MLDPDLAAFVIGSLPPPPARVLEVGAGRGELAEHLAQGGYDVTAVDPAYASERVTQVHLHELDEPPASFDAAVAVVSLHHVEPLRESCDKLAQLVRPGGTLVIDEFDIERFDERAAAWWLAQRDPREAGGHDHDHSQPHQLVGDLRHHLHPVAKLRDALQPAFTLGDPVRGPYLYRWDLPPGLRPREIELIAAGDLAAVGARLVGTRR